MADFGIVQLLASIAPVRRRQIRVLQSIPAYDFGGIETLVRQIFDRIDSRFQFDFLVHDPGANADLDHYQAKGARVIRPRTNAKANPLGYLREVRGAFLEAPERYDIFHCHAALYGTVHCAVAAWSGIPVRIAHAHSNDSDSSLDWLKAKAFLPVHKRLHTHHMACSESAARFTFGKAPGVLILPNGIATEAFRFDRHAREHLRQEFGLGEELAVGHTGRFCHPKNHVKVLNIFARLRTFAPNAKLLLAGDGPLMSAMQGLAADLGIARAVHFLGRRADIPQLLSAMDAFLFPSHYESFGLSPLEAHANGLPVVMADHIAGFLADGDTVTRLRLDRSDDDWARALEAASPHRDRSGRIDASLRSFDIATLVRNVEELYDNALASVRSTDTPTDA